MDIEKHLIITGTSDVSWKDSEYFVDLDLSFQIDLNRKES